jgi:hypothetical protein
MRPNRPAIPSALDGAIARFEAVAQRKRADAFAGARLPYPKEDQMNKITPLPKTAAGSAKILVPRIWTPGTKISEPGVYDMPIEAYHTDCCVGPSVSSSGLRTIDTQSLAHYWQDSYLNPEREPFKQSDAMALGSAAHHLLLGQEDFAKKFIVRPKFAPGTKDEPWHGAKLVCKKWNADAELARLTILKPDALEQITAMAEALARHPLIRDGLLTGSVEKSLFWQDSETGIWLKARPDCLASYGTVIADYKTTADASPGECEKTLWNFGYHMQLALGGMGIEALTGRRPDNDAHVLVFQEPKPPHCVSVRPIDPQAISYGRMQTRRALQKLAKALALRAQYEAEIIAPLRAKYGADQSAPAQDKIRRAVAQADADSFPGYETDLQSVGLPYWAAKQLEDDLKFGLLDKSAA